MPVLGILSISCAFANINQYVINIQINFGSNPNMGFCCCFLLLSFPLGLLQLIGILYLITFFCFSTILLCEEKNKIKKIITWNLKLYKTIIRNSCQDAVHKLNHTNKSFFVLLILLLYLIILLYLREQGNFHYW